MQNHRLNGQGTLTYDNGDTYTGGFKMVLLMVKELLNLTKVGLMKGEFKVLVKADGQGKLTTENKVIYKGKFTQGILKDEN